MTDPLPTLRRLARLHGVQTGYRDVRGAWVAAGPESLLATLRALGAPVARVDDAGEALRARVRALWRRVVPPVAVAWDGRPRELRLRVPDGRTEEPIRGRLDLEDGSSRTWTWETRALPVLRLAEVDGECFALLRALLPGPLPLGIHTLTLETGTRSPTCTVIAAPGEAYAAQGEPREPAWGVFAPLYALHTARTAGVGDLADYEALLSWVRQMGGAAIGTLPLLASFLDRPFEPSPYAPVSRLFWNELYLDPHRLPELERCPEARRVMESGEWRQEREALAAMPLVDYRRAAALRRSVLEPLARSFQEAPGPGRREALEAFLERRPEAADYARFRAAVERTGTSWPAWSGPAREGTLLPEDFDEAAFRYHLYAQWQIQAQVEELADRTRSGGRGLYLDLPLGVDSGGYDVWRHRDAFASGAAAGAPPDLFFTKGQNWGFAPLHPEGSREGGHRYLAACLRHHLRCAGILRIDHVMSLHRLFWIPRGMEGKDGVYVRYPAEETYAVVALESWRSRSLVVGEDLGVVPPYVRPKLERHRIHRMHVVEYELRPDRADPLDPAPSDSVAALNTHDMPPFAGFLAGTDIGDRQALGLLDEEQARADRATRREQVLALAALLRREGLPGDPDDPEALLRGALAHLRAGPARLVLVSLDDLWLETEPQNVPGTSHERPNWRRKLRYPLESFRDDPSVLRRLAAVREGIRR